MVLWGRHWCLQGGPSMCAPFTLCAVEVRKRERSAVDEILRNADVVRTWGHASLGVLAGARYAPGRHATAAAWRCATPGVLPAPRCAAPCLARPQRSCAQRKRAGTWWSSTSVARLGLGFGSGLTPGQLCLRASQRGYHTALRGAPHSPEGGTTQP